MVQAASVVPVMRGRAGGDESPWPTRPVMHFLVGPLVPCFPIHDVAVCTVDVNGFDTLLTCCLQC